MEPNRKLAVDEDHFCNQCPFCRCDRSGRNSKPRVCCLQWPGGRPGRVGGGCPERERQDVLEDLIGYFAIMEGIFFYSGFVMLLSFGRQNRLPGACEQIQYILRDESMHMNFGLETINVITTARLVPQSSSSRLSASTGAVKSLNRSSGSVGSSSR